MGVVGVADQGARNQHAPGSRRPGRLPPRLIVDSAFAPIDYAEREPVEVLLIRVTRAADRTAPESPIDAVLAPFIAAAAASEELLAEYRASDAPHPASEGNARRA